MPNNIEKPTSSQYASIRQNDDSNKQTATFLNKAITVIKKPIQYLINRASYKINNSPNEKPVSKKLQDMKISKPKDTEVVDLKQNQLSEAEKTVLLHNAETAALPYHQDISRINSIDTADSSWQFSQDISTEVQQLIQQDATDKLFKKANFDIKNGRIIDKKTGLTAYIIENSQTKEVKVIFGGTSSGQYAGGLIKRQMKNIKSVGSQWLANIKNILDSKDVPDSYQQASKLLEAVNKVIDSKGYSLKVLGHSKGAAEATFATLTQKKPSPAICFSSAELGEASLSKIPKENLDQLDKLINNYYVEGDIIPNVGKKFGFLSQKIKNLTKLGNYYKLPSEKKYNTPIDRHDKFVKHIRAFVKI